MLGCTSASRLSTLVLHASFTICGVLLVAETAVLRQLRPRVRTAARQFQGDASTIQACETFAGQLEAQLNADLLLTGGFGTFRYFSVAAWDPVREVTLYLADEHCNGDPPSDACAEEANAIIQSGNRISAMVFWHPHWHSHPEYLAANNVGLLGSFVEEAMQTCHQYENLHLEALGPCVIYLIGQHRPSRAVAVLPVHHSKLSATYGNIVEVTDGEHLVAVLPTVSVVG